MYFPPMKGKQKPIEIWLPLALMALVLLPFFALTFYLYPASDDYSFFLSAQKLNFFDFLHWGYSKLSGRYTAIAVTKVLNPLYSQSMLVYRLFSMAMFVWFSHSAYLVFKALFMRLGVAGTKPIAGAAIMVVYVWLFMPNLSELVYWYSAAYSYTLGLTLFLYWLYVLLQKPAGNIQKMLAVLLPIAIAGCCELAAILLLLTLIGAAIYYPLNRQRPQGYVLATAVVIVTACCAEFLAPGNFARSGDISYLFTQAQKHSMYFAVPATLGKFWSILSTQFLFGLFAMPVVLLLCIAMPKYKPATSLQIIAKWALLPALLIIPLLLFPYYWSTGLEFIPLRIINYCFVGFSLLFIPAAFVVCKPLVTELLEYGILRYTLVGLIVMGFAFRSNIRYAVADLKRIETYKTQMEGRYSELNRGKGKDLVFRPLRYKPQTILHADLDADAGHWYNRSLAAYYWVGSVRRSPSQTLP